MAAADRGTALRAVAAQTLARVLGGSTLNACLPAALDKVSARDRGLLQQLCYGCLRLYPRLQAQLTPLLDKPLRDKDRDIQALLLLGLYQLEAMRIPDHAAVAATVGATRVLRKDWARGLCNAVLRRYQREAETLAGSLPAAAAAAHPPWLYDAIHREWPAQAEAIIHANNAPPPMTLRVNRQRLSRDDYREALRAAGLVATAGQLSADALTLAQPVDVAELPGFHAGQVSVQDEAAQLAAQLLPLAPGDRVLDACAAPGGKACHLLEHHPQLALTAMDVDPERLGRVRENLSRLGLQAELVTGDAAQPPAVLRLGQFQGILADVPCSATGVIRRHPDIKLLRRPADLAAMARQQVEILEGLWPLLATGGHLLYVTCSILATENHEVVMRFLQGHEDARLLELPVHSGQTRPAGRQWLPAADGSDGLYYALLRKGD